MKRYRLSGDVLASFVHEINAENPDQAEHFVTAMPVALLDSIDYKTAAIEVHEVEEVTD